MPEAKTIYDQLAEGIRSAFNSRPKTVSRDLLWWCQYDNSVEGKRSDIGSYSGLQEAFIGLLRTIGGTDVRGRIRSVEVSGVVQGLPGIASGSSVNTIQIVFSISPGVPAGDIECNDELIRSIAELVQKSAAEGVLYTFLPGAVEGPPAVGATATINSIPLIGEVD